MNPEEGIVHQREMLQRPGRWEGFWRSLVLAAAFAFGVPILFFFLLNAHHHFLLREYSDRIAVVQEHPIPDDPAVWESVKSALSRHDIESRPINIAVDADGDGKPDNFRASGRSWSIDLSLDGSTVGGSFPSGLSVPHSAGADDIDGDGIADLWISDPADDTLWIFYGDEEREFRQKQQIIDKFVARGAFMDMDGDGDLDFVSDGFNDGGGDYVRWYWVEMDLKKQTD